jgi:hypothetical protein
MIQQPIPLRRSHSLRPPTGWAFAPESDDAPLFTQRQVDEQVSQALKRERAVTSAILTGAAPHRPLDPNAVVRIAQDAITMNDKGALVVLTEKGTTRYGSDGNPMSVTAFMGHFAQEHAYLFEAKEGQKGRRPAAQDTKGLTGIQKIALGFTQRKT